MPRGWGGEYSCSCGIISDGSHSYFVGWLSRGCKPHNDFEPCGQLSDARFFDRSERDDNGGPLFWIPDPAQNAVLIVAGLALNVTLRGELLPSLDFDGEVYVGGTAGVWNRLDRAEIVFTRGARHKAA